MLKTLYWNVNGLSIDKIDQYSLQDFFDKYNLVLLCETRSGTWGTALFQTHRFQVFTVPAPDTTPGRGLLVAVRRDPRYYAQTFHMSQHSIWIRLVPTGPHGHKPLILSLCYVPHAASHQLDDLPAQDLFDSLAVKATIAAQEGILLMGGDFNSRVGPSVPPEPPRGTKDPVTNSHGRRLLSLCATAGLTLCTGRTPGDTEGVPTYVKTIAGQVASSRGDHILVSSPHHAHIINCTVAADKRGSDHFALALTVQLPWCRPPPVAPQGSPLHSLRWTIQAHEPYVRALEATSFEACRAATRADDLTDAVHLLTQGILKAAKTAGMMPRQARGPPLPRHRNSPWFDPLCLYLKRRWYSARRRRGPHARLLAAAYEAEYTTHYKRIKRTYLRDEVDRLAAAHAADPSYLYRCLRQPRTPLPPQLSSPVAWDGFLTALTSPLLGAPGVLTFPPHFPPPPCGPHDAASLLDEAITVDEVVNALRTLKNRRSPGILGISAEFYKSWGGDTESPFFVALHETLQALFQRGPIPQSLNIALIAPVFKKGDQTLPSNYRPIGVGDTLLKLYASTLHTRLNSYLEHKCLRSPAQAGCRERHSTSACLFLLQALRDQAQLAHLPLYVCFVDLKGAFDNVPRHLIWAALRRLGVTGVLLRAIQALYVNAQYAVTVDGHMGTTQQSHKGVRQGCPLSATLFGILLDGLEAHVAAVTAGSGAILSHEELATMALFVDDIALYSNTATGLQAAMHASHGYLASINQQLGITKTAVMVFPTGPLPPTPPMWHMGGHVISEVTEYQYLGVPIRSAPGMTIGHPFPALTQRVYGAWALLTRKLGNVHCNFTLATKVHLFRTFVLSTAQYALDVWGIRALEAPYSKALQDLQGQLVGILRQLTGVSGRVSWRLLLSELDLPTLWDVSVSMSLTLSRQLAKQDEASIFRTALCTSAVTALGHGAPAPCNWVGALALALAAVGHGPLWVSVATSLPSIDYQIALRLLAEHSAKMWSVVRGMCPRTCPSAGAAFTKYFVWFRADPIPHLQPQQEQLQQQVQAEQPIVYQRGQLQRQQLWGRPRTQRHAFLAANLGPRRAAAVLRFRLGDAPLPIVEGKFCSPRVLRAARLCELCHLGVLGDEQHLLLECPAMEEVRAHYGLLFSPGAPPTMRQFMAQRPAAAVASFVADCLDLSQWLRPAQRPL